MSYGSLFLLPLYTVIVDSLQGWATVVAIGTLGDPRLQTSSGCHAEHNSLHTEVSQTVPQQC